MSNPQKNLADVIRTIADQVRADGASHELREEIRALYWRITNDAPYDVAEKWAREDGSSAYRRAIQSIARGVEHDFAAWRKQNPYTARSEQARETLEELINSAVDGACTYTADVLDIIRWCDDHDAYEDAYGEPPVDGRLINWPAVAACALDQELLDVLDVESMLAEEA